MMIMYMTHLKLGNLQVKLKIKEISNMKQKFRILLKKISILMIIYKLVFHSEKILIGLVYKDKESWSFILI